MPLTTDFIMNDIFKTLSSIPFALFRVSHLEDEKEGYVINLNCKWTYEVRLYTPNAILIEHLGEYEEPEDAKAKVLMVLDQMKLLINEAIIVYDSEYQILNDYHFDRAGYVAYTFNSVRFSKDEVAIEYDLFAENLDDKSCLRDFHSFVEAIKRDTAAKWAVQGEPALLQTIRKRKLERILGLHYGNIH
jgi:hypothetical protein